MYIDFNSLKVRLKANSPESSSYALKFQFLKGSIKRTLRETRTRLLIKFQFLKGSIKSFAVFADIGGRSEFQFLKGSIKRMISYQTFTQVTAISIP